MHSWTSAGWGAAALGIVAVSSLLTWASIAYARRYNLVDQPGQRRSHAQATPRGGGIGIVVAALLASAVSMAVAASRDFAVPALVLAILLVASVGWIDDHRGLGARPRLLAHGLAAIVLVGSAGAQSGLFMSGLSPTEAALLVVALLAVVWSINLHNFMDGIDGLLASQALFVLAVMAGLAAASGQVPEAALTGLFAAATLGFLPFNFPRARVFMGDVGSGVLGLLVAVVVGWQMLAWPVALASGLIACSAFVVDATATLLTRMLRGRRWYSAHREHLYQWLVRGGRSHAAVVGLYAGWNLFVAAPVLYWLNRPYLAIAAGSATAPSLAARDAYALLAVYAAATLVWAFGKRHCLVKARNGAGRSGV